MKDYSKGKRPDELEPFFPNEILRVVIAALIVVILILALVVAIPESFQEMNHEISSYASAAPAWYLLPFYKLFNTADSIILAVLVCTIGALSIIALPFIRNFFKR